MPLLHQSLHLHERLDAPTRRRPARRPVAEALDDARDPLAVEVLARHHDDAAIAEEQHARQDAAVPERDDRALTRRDAPARRPRRPRCVYRQVRPSAATSGVTTPAISATCARFDADCSQPGRRVTPATTPARAVRPAARVRRGGRRGLPETARLAQASLRPRHEIDHLDVVGAWRARLRALQHDRAEGTAHHDRVRAGGLQLLEARLADARARTRAPRTAGHRPRRSRTGCPSCALAR